MEPLRIDGVRLGVADLEEAAATYVLLLGVAAVARPDGTRRFQLGRGAVELASSGPHTVRLTVAGVGDRPLPDAAHGLALRFDAADDGAPPPTPGALEAIDHIVVHTPDPDRAITFWRDGMGLRLALDRVFAERGLRLLFFRSGGITLEYAAAHPTPAERGGSDRLHGVSYRVGDLASHHERLARAGLDVSPLRPGMRPGTRVITVRSGTAGVPTLLIEGPHSPTGAKP